MIKHILFDLDDTLLDFRKAEAVAIAATLTKLGIKPDEAIISRYSAINAGLWKKLENGELSRAEVLVQRFDVLFSELGADAKGELAWQIYESLLGEGHYFIDGALDLLEALYPKYNLYLASNGTASVQDSRIASAGIARYFQNIFISQRIGFDKPHPGFFEHCFNSISGFSKDEVIIIGDSLSSDIRGANLSGIRSCWFNPGRKPREEGIFVDFELASLDEVPALLNRI